MVMDVSCQLFNSIFKGQAVPNSFTCHRSFIPPSLESYERRDSK